MDDKGIPPPDFNPGESYNVNDDQYLEEEADSFKDLVKRQDQDQEKKQKESLEQLKKKEDSLKSLVQREEMNEEAALQDEDKGIDEEDAKSVSEEDEFKSTEERRAASLSKGKQRQSSFIEEENIGVIKDNQKISEEGDEEGIETGVESEDPLHQAKQEVLQEKAALRADRSETESDKAHSKESIKGSQKQKQAADETKASKKSPNIQPKKKPEKTKETQSIAANLALGANPIETSKTQKGTLNADQKVSSKELEKLIKKIIEEAEVLKDGDEVKTTISVDMPDSIFNKGEITVSTFKYRPLEVNLKFKKFNSKGSAVLKQNQEELKNVLKINSLKVHQLEIIE